MHKRRIKEIDMSRGVTILLVVLGHTAAPMLINSVLTSFRMPLFFLIAGFLINLEKYIGSPIEFLRGRLYRLIIPYFASGLLFYLLWLLKQQIGEQDDQMHWLLPLLGIIYGNREWLFVNIPLWFLVTLFCAELVFSFVMSKIHKLNIILQFISFLIIGCFGFVVGKLVHLPWGIDIALLVQPYLYFGYFLKTIGLFNEFRISFNKAILYLCIFLLCSKLNGFVDISERNYGNLIYFYLAGFSGSLFVLFLTGVFSLNKPFVKYLTYIGKKSIYILIFHTGTFFVISLLYRLDQFGLSENWFYYWFFGIILSLIIAECIERYSLLRMLFGGTGRAKKAISTKI